MQQEDIVAKRYAKALIDLSIEQNTLDAVYKDMVLIDNLVSNCKELRLLLKSPIIKKRTKIAILETIFKDQISLMTSKYVQIITRKKREEILGGVAYSFILRYNKLKNITSATVTTVEALDDELRLKINKLVKSLSTADVELKEEINPAILGGFILQVGDKQINASLIKSLSVMKQQFKKNLYKRQF